ncbi:unnamed protein product, partial [Musa acuminata subsp. burmannicoides]
PKSRIDGRRRNVSQTEEEEEGVATGIGATETSKKPSRSHPSAESSALTKDSSCSLFPFFIFSLLIAPFISFLGNIESWLLPFQESVLV